MVNDKNVLLLLICGAVLLFDITILVEPSLLPVTIHGVVINKISSLVESVCLVGGIIIGYAVFGGMKDEL